MSRRPPAPIVRRRGSRRLAIAFSSVIATFVVIMAACSDQGEGERCEVYNRNSDCKTDEGLICYPAAQLNGSSSDRCCPSDRTKAMNPVCKSPVSIGADATPPQNTTPTTPTDSGTKSDAAGDAASTSDAASSDDAGDAADQ